MNEAIRTADEITEQKTKPTTEQHQEHMGKLKPEINNLLHTFLPEDIKVGEVEVLAMVINDIVHNPRKYLKGSEYQMTNYE